MWPRRWVLLAGRRPLQGGSWCSNSLVTLNPGVFSLSQCWVQKIDVYVLLGVLAQMPLTSSLAFLSNRIKTWASSEHCQLEIAKCFSILRCGFFIFIKKKKTVCKAWAIRKLAEDICFKVFGFCLIKDKCTFLRNEWMPTYLLITAIASKGTFAGARTWYSGKLCRQLRLCSLDVSWDLFPFCFPVL